MELVAWSRRHIWSLSDSNSKFLFDTYDSKEKIECVTSNVDNDVSDFEVGGFSKTGKPETLEKKFFSLD